MNTDIVADREKYAKGWTGGLPETPCGYGSTMRATREQRSWIPAMFRKHGIVTVADIGAGDLNWIRHTDLTGIEYQAYDLVPRRPQVMPFDLLEEIPPAVDCIMLLWVLNHFPYDECRKALKNIKASGARYLMMTDRPKWHSEQPKAIQMQALDALLLNSKGDRIKLIRL